MNTHAYRFLLTATLLASWLWQPTGAQANTSRTIVPELMAWCGMELELTPAAQRKIQEEVDRLTAYPKYYERKMVKAQLYMPVVEEVLAQEGLPDDFKFLPMQESNFTADAVSKSNAVGFWQFKRVSGMEVGLRIDNTVDERMNIVSSTRGAAKYLISNNSIYNNWVYALMAYYEGALGARKYAKDRYIGATRMTVTSDMHWYVLRFLAHVIAFRGPMKQLPTPPRILYAYNDTQGKSLKDIAVEMNVPIDTLKTYNVWLKARQIPEDRSYAVLWPTTPPNSRPQQIPLITRSRTLADHARYEAMDETALLYPRVKPMRNAHAQSLTVRVNGIPGIVASVDDDMYTLAAKGGLTTEKFMDYNDLDSYHKVIAGQVYYFKKKRNKAQEHYHTVYDGETLWSISQKYGVKVRKIMRKNRISEQDTPLQLGRVLWMRFTRPDEIPVEYRQLNGSKPAATNMPQGQNNQNATTGSANTDNTSIQGNANQTSQATPTNETTGSTAAAQASGTGESPQTTGSMADSVTNNMAEHTVNNSANSTAEASPPPTPQDSTVAQTQPNNQENYTGQVPAQPTDTVADSTQESSNAGAVQQAWGSTQAQPSQPLQGTDSSRLEWPSLHPNDSLVNSTGANTTNDEPGTGGQAPTVPATGPVKHTVAPGETLYAISRKYRVNVDDLIDWNELANPGALSVGQTLLIKYPGALSPEPQPVQEGITPPHPPIPEGYHTVAAGDTLWSLSRKFGVTVDELIKWNKLTGTSLQLGQRLRIKAP